MASDESDVNVTIGTLTCNVTSLASTQLVCSPPLSQPAPTDELGVRTETELPLVVVSYTLVVNRVHTLSLFNL